METTLLRRLLRAIERALAENPNIRVIACGLPEVVQPFAASHERCEAQPASEVIADRDEHPAQRSAPQEGLVHPVVGCRLVKEGRAQGFFSAGSTGACLSAATLVVGRIKGIKRPALGQILPGYGKPTLLLDVGANADCKPEYLVQFGLMGAVYMRQLMGVASPKVGLLNIGEEPEKGSEFALECHQQLAQHLSAFGGNAEGRRFAEWQLRCGGYRWVHRQCCAENSGRCLQDPVQVHKGCVHVFPPKPRWGRFW